MNAARFPHPFSIRFKYLSQVQRYVHQHSRFYWYSALRQVFKSILVENIRAAPSKTIFARKSITNSLSSLEPPPALLPELHHGYLSEREHRRDVPSLGLQPNSLPHTCNFWVELFFHSAGKFFLLTFPLLSSSPTVREAQRSTIEAVTRRMPPLSDQEAQGAKTIIPGVLCSTHLIFFAFFCCYFFLRLTASF